MSQQDALIAKVSDEIGTPVPYVWAVAVGETDPMVIFATMTFTDRPSLLAACKMLLVAAHKIEESDSLSAVPIFGVPGIASDAEAWRLGVVGKPERFVATLRCAETKKGVIADQRRGFAHWYGDNE